MPVGPWGGLPGGRVRPPAKAIRPTFSGGLCDRLQNLEKGDFSTTFVPDATTCRDVFHALNRGLPMTLCTCITGAMHRAYRLNMHSA